MKHFSTAFSVVLLCSFLLASCGKTSQQQQMESDLNKRVMQMHDSEMVKMRQAQALDSQLDSAKILIDSLSAKFPKDFAGRTSDDIAQAKAKLETAQGAMREWMSAHRPYDAELKHDVAMAKLNADVQDLMKVGTALDTAIVDATGTIENHRKIAAELLSKKAAKKSAK